MAASSAEGSSPVCFRKPSVTPAAISSRVSSLGVGGANTIDPPGTFSSWRRSNQIAASRSRTPTPNTPPTRAFDGLLVVWVVTVVVFIGSTVVFVLLLVEAKGAGHTRIRHPKPIAAIPATTIRKRITGCFFAPSCCRSRARVTSSIDSAVLALGGEENRDGCETAYQGSTAQP